MFQVAASVLLGFCGLDDSAEAMGHQLLAIADAQGGNAFQNGKINVGRAFFEHTAGTAAQDHGRRLHRLDLLARLGPGDHFGIDVEFPNAANDQLGVLASEVYDEDRLVSHKSFYLRGGRAGSACIKTHIKRFVYKFDGFWGTRLDTSWSNTFVSSFGGNSGGARGGDLVVVEVPVSKAARATWGLSTTRLAELLAVPVGRHL